MFKKFLTLLTLSIFSLVGCGDGGDGTAATATGIFKDATTAGLTYSSGAQSGITGTDGSFTYEVGKTVTFTIGAITVGTANGSPVVTPVDLVTGGDTSNVAVLNIVRVLNLLDSDGITSNGIQISSDMRTEAEYWTALDLSTPLDLTTVTTTQNLTAMQTAADVVTGETHALMGEAAAQTHIETTLACAYAGAFSGSWSGSGDAGYFAFLVDATNNNVVGSAVIISSTGVDIANMSLAQKTWHIVGTTPLGFEQDPSFVSGTTTPSTGIFSTVDTTYTGQFNSVNSVSGTYTFSGGTTGSGTYSGSRVGGSSTAKHRVTGAYIGVDTGVFAMDIDASGVLTGVGASSSDGRSFSISGTYDSDIKELSGTTSGGGSFYGLYDPATGLVTSGTWSPNQINNTDGGTVSGSGCQLN